MAAGVHLGPAGNMTMVIHQQRKIEVQIPSPLELVLTMGAAIVCGCLLLISQF
jgi:hypothetical protein